MTVSVAGRRIAGLIALVAVAVSVVWIGTASRASAASSTPVVYVATGENFPDALGAASAAAVQAGPVLLITKTSIPLETRTELTRLAPDVIYVAGGTAVVSDTVFNQLKDYAPSVVRVAGANRYATAAKVSQSAFPATTGGGANTAALEAAVAALTARLDTLEAENGALTTRLDTVESEVAPLTTRIDTLEAENAALQSLLSGVSRDGDTLLFTGMNLQIVNGEGATDTSNSLGNVIIGYNEPGMWNPARTGSHYLITGTNNAYTGYAAIVSGHANTSTGAYASVLGGMYNLAAGECSSVTGGVANEVVGDYDTIVGGDNISGVSADGGIVVGEGLWDPPDTP